MRTAIKPECTILQSSALLRLPKECRDIIYGHLLTTDMKIRWPADTQHALFPEILQSCRQAYFEGAAILYKTNSFVFAHPSDCNVFRHIMDTSCTRSISHVTFYIQARFFEKIWRPYITNKFPWRSLARDLPLLKSLTVVLEGSAWQTRRHPEENLQDWFGKEVAFNSLCQILQLRSSDPRKDDIDVNINCRQRIPQAHFDHLNRFYTGTPANDLPTRLPLVLLRDTCLRVSTSSKMSRSVTLDLLSPADEAPI